MKSSIRNEIKAQIIRAGYTMQEVVDQLHDEVFTRLLIRELVEFIGNLGNVDGGKNHLVGYRGDERIEQHHSRGTDDDRPFHALIHAVVLHRIPHVIPISARSTC